MATNILLVDDEYHIIELFEMLLVHEGYNVLTASNGAECLQILKEHTVDLIVLDVRMPDMDGWETLRSMSEIPNLSDIPVILSTARTSSVDKVLGLQVFGVKDYLVKPFRPSDLLASIRRALGEGEAG